MWFLSEVFLLQPWPGTDSLVRHVLNVFNVCLVKRKEQVEGCACRCMLLFVVNRQACRCRELRVSPAGNDNIAATELCSCAEGCAHGLLDTALQTPLLSYQQHTLGLH